jgi:hypothetical protein
MTAPVEAGPGQVHTYQSAAIRDDVCPVVLARALAMHGLTFSVEADLGVVIKPMPEPLNAS